MNPALSAILKTLVVVVGGSLAPVALNAVDHPTGGLATAIATDPVYGIAWAGLSYTLHNFYDHYFGAPVAPQAKT